MNFLRSKVENISLPRLNFHCRVYLRNPMEPPDVSGQGEALQPIQLADRSGNNNKSSNSSSSKLRSSKHYMFFMMNTFSRCYATMFLKLRTGYELFKTCTSHHQN